MSEKKINIGEKMGFVKAISISEKKGVRKKNIPAARLITNFGLENDGHGGNRHRQVSFLGQESIEKMRKKGLDVVAGNFAENITTEGIKLKDAAVGTHLKIGDTRLVISQLGKICHARCAIYKQAGDCVMPREGVFATVLQGGGIRVGDTVQVLNIRSPSLAIIMTEETRKEMGKQISTTADNILKSIVVRYDTLHDKEGGTPSALLTDLVLKQRNDTIIIFNPRNDYILTMTCNHYKKYSSTLYHCNSLASLNKYFAMLEVAPISLE